MIFELQLHFIYRTFYRSDIPVRSCPIHNLTTTSAAQALLPFQLQTSSRKYNSTAGYYLEHEPNQPNHRGLYRLFCITKHTKKPTNISFEDGLKMSLSQVPASWYEVQFTNVQGFHKENLNCYSICTYFVIITKNCSKLVPIMYPDRSRPQMANTNPCKICM